MNVADQATASAADSPVHSPADHLSRNCPHQPPCPAAEAADHDLALIRVAHPEQGWTLLCNGVILFDDTGELLPDGRVIPPQRARVPLAT